MILADKQLYIALQAVGVLAEPGSVHRVQAIEEAKGPGWWLDYIPQNTARWLGSHVVSRDADTDPNLLVDFLTGINEAGNALVAEFYGCLQAFKPVCCLQCT